MPKKLTLTTQQWEIVELMREGWELGTDGSMHFSAWLQKGGLGRGGEVRNVHGNQFNTLYDKGMIKRNLYGFPRSIYQLTELGKTLKKEKA